MRHYSIIPPSPHLAEHIRYFWTLTVHIRPGEQISMNSYVDDSCGIAFQVRDADVPIFWNQDIVPPGVIYGLTTKFHSLESVCSFAIFGVIFHSHALYSIFGLAPAHFSDKAVNLEHAVDKYITEQIYNAADTASRIQIMETFIEKRLNRSARCSKYIHTLCDYISKNKGILSVQQIEKEFGIHMRQLERKFREQIGVSPMHFIKIARFREVMRLLKADNYTRLTEIAYELEFADQSHFIKQVRRFSGFTPRQLRQQPHEQTINLLLDPGVEKRQKVIFEEPAVISV